MCGVYKASVFALIICGIIAATEAQTPSPASPTGSCISRTNTSCDHCLKNVTCLWCESSRQCVDYPVRNILPRSNVCPLNDARWGVCWVNFQILIISMSVLAGIILLAIAVCCCCCCCCRRKRERSGNKREDEKVERETQARKARQKARRTEMQLRHDEIRQKYGLAKDNPYARIDDR